MYIARILYPVRVLGPGKRIGVWFCGCHRRCPGCSNPELWERQERYKTSFVTMMNLVQHICAAQQVDGFTLTGGDPFEQPDALKELLPAFSRITNDILAYTGYTFAQIQERYPDLAAQMGVLIDGEYIESRNTGVLLRGSDNQNIIVLDKSLRPKYQDYLSNMTQNEIQNFTTMDGVISVGIHDPGYSAQLDSILNQKGLEKHG